MSCFRKEATQHVGLAQSVGRQQLVCIAGHESLIPRIFRLEKVPQAQLSTYGPKEAKNSRGPLHPAPPVRAKFPLQCGKCRNVNIPVDLGKADIHIVRLTLVGQSVRYNSHRHIQFALSPMSIRQQREQVWYTDFSNTGILQKWE